MAATPRKKAPARRKSSSASRFSWAKVLSWGFVLLFTAGVVLHYRDALLYYFSFKSKHNLQEDKVAEARIFQILQKYPDYCVGLDVSEYQGAIDWEAVDSLEGRPIRFVFVRATCGRDRKDAQFEANWKGAKKFIRGVYHYYRPDENSLEQARKFIASVALQPSDLPPVLDIEQVPENQSMEQLKVGLQKWLDAVEKHYQRKPIIYSGQRYYEDFLKKEFSGYTFWVANYNFFAETLQPEWLFWQFSEKGRVEGIPEKVDVNLYNGTPKMLEYLVHP
ncbi:GH25 family lysozyme [Flavobacterium sp.]|jgi:lysozyme|uniref:GH25 family lysozyme n=1 Tax=Flavobacterium sp. TaxID=239 RepID=UPI0022BF5B27|nr:GH25 family lysozyme [Flavobacterium sp.]MCZ8144080.1 GH25 family lysozyme [Flavobacterium sp.]MCZ8366299.1 GH25 family lysozyme [Flavobacterium sp.]